jgi:hypothetical protein
VFAYVQHDGDTDPNHLSALNWNNRIHICAELSGTSRVPNSSDRDGRHEEDEVDRSVRSSGLLGGMSSTATALIALR